MKILGSLILIWGIGLTLSTVFNYWMWFALQGKAIESLTPSDRAFVEGSGHGFFILITIIGILISAGGVKLILLKRLKRTDGQ